MRRIIRFLAGVLLSGLLIAIVAGVAGEFFIELAREWGWYDNPSNKVVSAVSAFAAFVTHPLFTVAAAIIAGFVGGLWLDWGLRRTESSSDASRELAKKLDDLFAEGVARRNALGSIATHEVYSEKYTEIVKWSSKVYGTLNNELVTVKEMSDFRTLNVFDRTLNPLTPKSPFNQHIDSMWNEKLIRLKRIIDRLGR